MLQEAHGFTRNLKTLMEPQPAQRWHVPALWVGALALVVIALKLVLK